jgi:hypothetical protein
VSTLSELDQHPEVRRELLTAMIEDSLKERGRTYSPKEVHTELRAMVREYANTEPPSAGSTPLLLGFDGSNVAHMWRTAIRPNNAL